jgi:hypothetical protein
MKTDYYKQKEDEKVFRNYMRELRSEKKGLLPQYITNIDGSKSMYIQYHRLRKITNPRRTKKRY